MKDLIEDLKVMEKTKNYNRWIYNNIKPYMGRRVVEAGCGIGNITGHLLDSDILIAIDESEKCIKFMKSKYSRKNILVMNCDLSDKKMLEIKKYCIDTIVCINVLEHIKDDIKALQYFYELLEEKGRLILMVPAFNILYGSIDKGGLHYRRYSKRILNEKLEIAMFNIQKRYYFNIFGMVPWIITGKILRRTVQPSLEAIDKFVPLCAFIEKILMPPIGLSLIYVCEKT